ncbi:MAG: potassium/proton antiporter, partial [Chitinophagaceae bacterium]
FNLVFFISVTSVLLQGTTLSWMARRLGVSVAPDRRRLDAAFETDDQVHAEQRILQVQSGAFSAGRRIVELNLPSRVTILSIERDGRFVLPNGSTRLAAGDRVQVLAPDKSSLEELRALGWSE